MKPSDYLGFAFAGLFGLWWVLLPNSVIRFYRSFHGDELRVPKPLVIRFIGIAWLILVLVIGLTLSSTRTPPALSSALSQFLASSAPLIASAQAGPVSFIR